MQTRNTISSFISVFLLLFLVSCGSKSHQQAEQASSPQIEIQRLSADEFEQKLSEAGEDAQLVDVRTTHEYGNGHLVDAANIDVSSPDFKKQLETLNKQVPVFVYCRSGNRSMRAAKMMKEKGFTEIYELRGGILEWEQEGKQTE